MPSKPARVGFLSDTHSRKPDGSDLPAGVLAAFADVDLIVHLGDIGRHGILERLEALAPLLVQTEDRKGYAPRDASRAPAKVIDVGGLQVGLTFNLSLPDKKIVVTDGVPVFPEGPIDSLMVRRFKSPVDAVAFGGTHAQHQGAHEGILFFNPGSPTLPTDSVGDGDLGSVAILTVAKGTPAVELIRLHP